MPQMTVQDLRDYVRVTLDTDDTELPDVLLDVWRDEGYSHVERFFEPWSFLKTSWTVAIAQGTSSVALNGLTPDDPNVTTEIERITAVIGDSWGLRYIPHEVALIRYQGGTDVTGTPVEGPPLEYSIDAGELFFWPVASSSYTYRVWGYRRPTDMVADTDIPDLPQEFHPLIAEWMLARAYEQQDDDVMSNQKFGRVEQQLQAFKRRYTRGPNAGTQVIGQYHEREGEWAYANRLRYSWEF